MSTTIKNNDLSLNSLDNFQKKKELQIKPCKPKKIRFQWKFRHFNFQIKIKFQKTP